MSWPTSELRVRLAPLNRFKPSSKIFYWPFQGGTSFVDILCFCCVLCLLCLYARLFICALWSPAGKGLTSWLSFVVSNCEFVTFPLVSWVRCGTWLYLFLIFAPLLTLISQFLATIWFRLLSVFTESSEKRFFCMERFHTCHCRCMSCSVSEDHPVCYWQTAKGQQPKVDP